MLEAEILIFLICILTGCSCMVCNAGSDTLKEEKQTTFGVYATYIAGETDYFTAPVENGESEISLPDGTVITVGDISEDCLTLVVYPVTDRDEDAWKWFLACMEGKGRSILPYEIYFLNKDGDRLPANGAAVSILLPESIEAPAVFSLDRDGIAVRLASEIAGSKIVFRTGGRYYYVLAESADTETPAVPTPGDGTEPTITPMPGDEAEPTATSRPGTETESTTTPASGANDNTAGIETGGTAAQGIEAQTKHCFLAFGVYFFCNNMYSRYDIPPQAHILGGEVEM